MAAYVCLRPREIALMLRTWARIVVTYLIDSWLGHSDQRVRTGTPILGCPTTYLICLHPSSMNATLRRTSRRILLKTTPFNIPYTSPQHPGTVYNLHVVASTSLPTHRFKVPHGAPKDSSAAGVSVHSGRPVSAHARGYSPNSTSSPALGTPRNAHLFYTFLT